LPPSFVALLASPPACTRTLSLHDALPICTDTFAAFAHGGVGEPDRGEGGQAASDVDLDAHEHGLDPGERGGQDAGQHVWIFDGRSEEHTSEPVTRSSRMPSSA